MTVQVRARLTKRSQRDVDRLLRKLRLDTTAGRRISEKALTRAALEVQKISTTKKIVRGRARDAPPLPDRLTNRSGGRGLVGSIALIKEELPASIGVGTDLVYGPVHELGLGRFPERPFLSPALEEVEPKLADFYIREINKELNRT